MSEPSRPLSRSEEKRQRILETAMELFCSQGFVNTSMDAIAREADVSKQTIYSHFGSKDDLFVAAIRAKCQQANLSEDMFNQQESVEVQLQRFARSFSELVLSDDAIRVLRTCISSADQQPHLGHLLFNEGPLNVIRLLTQYLQLVAGRGELAISDPYEAAVQLLMMLMGEGHLRRKLGLPYDAQSAAHHAYLRNSVALFLRGYRA
ncbi:TetR/AcrR family transcriptional regulator [Pokkaliibacter sp. MBI-7]|uniref:TetR/AcrR family transcriptional regulator n=1 Tax=Pokkaliibacter sp. MBI-7 TaxID=3040600 RepID=UPI002447183C|nr:TetR/AcrR family transcriptional regulator [Pokkaliibacter sp. MBI-7]MDH2433728.1 TetR/AcrR family transcriptional regulator [Pokkaliibacter sp. MBI-7]